MSTNGTFIITGGSRNMGRALAKKAFSKGFSVALIARTESDLNAVKEELEACRANGENQKATIHVADLCSENEVKAAFKVISHEHSWIRGLINNAGTWVGRKPTETLTREDVAKALDLNFYSAFMSTNEVLAIHRKRGSNAELSIAFLGATASLQGRKNVAAFCLSKGANRILAQSLARELGPDGIHISHIVLDGLFDNERTIKLNPDLSSDRFMKQSQIAESIITVMLQDRSCWTFELDLRPFNESW